MLKKITTTAKTEQQQKLKVKTYCINEGQETQYFGLITIKNDQIIRFAPNNWKTEKGALRWAIKHGFST